MSITANYKPKKVFEEEIDNHWEGDYSHCTTNTFDYDITLNNITEYECVFRSYNTICKTGYIVDDAGNIISGELKTRLSVKYTNLNNFLPEHWSRTDITSNTQVITSINQEKINTADPSSNRYQIQNNCVGHSLPSLSNSIVRDFDSTKKFSLIAAKNKDLTNIIATLKTQINKRFVSPKYKALYNDNKLTSLSNISSPITGNYITQLGQLINCIKKLQGSTNYDQYPETTIETPNNIIQTNIIKDAANAITYDMQDCICYSDCNGYSVCWCYGNCNYY